MERLCRILDFTTGNGHHDHDSRFHRLLSSQPQRTNLPKNPMASHIHMDPLGAHFIANHHPIQGRCGSALHLLPVLMNQNQNASTISQPLSLSLSLKWLCIVILSFTQILAAQQNPNRPSTTATTQSLTNNPSNNNATNPSHEDSSIICLTCNELQESPKLKKALQKLHNVRVNNLNYKCLRY